MFNNEDTSREGLNEDYAFQKSKRDKDYAMRNEISAKYSQMIKDLESGKVHPEAYLNEEKINLSHDQIAQMRDSKAFAELWQKKYELGKAREDASLKYHKKQVLEKITGEEIDNINFDRIENNLTPQQFHEYRQRLFQSHEEGLESTDQPDNTEE